jgi:transposase
MAKAYTHDNDDEIAALYLTGESGKSIGRRFGITDGTVYNALKRKGISRRNNGMPITWEDNEQNHRDLIAAYEVGAGITVLARRFRINKRRVTQVLNEGGVNWRHPGGKRRFGDEDAAEFARAYHSGETLTEIGRRYAVSTQVVRHYLIRAGVQLRPVGAPAFWTDERKAEVTRYYLAGHQLKDIAAVMGCGTGTLTRTLVELGVHERKRSRGVEHHSWQGGRIIDSSGYARVKVPESDRHLADGTRAGYMMEHRLVMARKLGRRLLKSETVHHVNGDKRDNDPGNLQLRQGKHGKGAVFRCASCGSHDVEAVPLEG